MDDIWQIPIRTYCGAMRVAARYSMEDIKIAIPRVISKLPSPGIGQAVWRLAFMAEFPAYFSVSLAGGVLLQSCSLSSTPSSDDLKPLMGYPALIAAIIRKRETMLKIQMQPQKYQPQQSWNWDEPRAPTPGIEGWLQEVLESLGFPE